MKVEEKFDDYELLDPDENSGEKEVPQKFFTVVKREPDEKTKQIIEEFDKAMRGTEDRVFTFNNVDFGLGPGIVEIHIHD